MGGSIGGGKQKSGPAYINTPTDIKGLRKGISGGWQDWLSQSGQDALWRAPGLLGNIQQNILSQNPTEDYLGAKSALSDTISGQGYGPMVDNLRQQLIPGATRQYQDLLANLASGANSGNRYSSSLMDRASQGAQRISLGTQEQAMNTAGQLWNTRAAQAANIFNTAAGVKSPMEQLMSWVLGYKQAPGGQRSSGWDFNASVGKKQ